MRRKISGIVITLFTFLSMVMGEGWVMAMEPEDLPALEEDAYRYAEQMLVASGAVVDVIEEQMMSGPAGAMFRGSETPSFIRKLVILLIREYITDEVVTVVGLEESKIAQEIYVMACVYHDAIHTDGRDAEEAHRLATDEGVRYLLVEKLALNDDDARAIISSIRNSATERDEEPTVQESTVGSFWDIDLKIGRYAERWASITVFISS